MSGALRAEWTKLRTLGTTGWLLLAAVALTVALSGGVIAVTHVSSGGGQDPTRLALTGVDLGQAVIAVLAIVTISEEYATGMIRVTLAAVPGRLAVLGAKAANLAGLALLAGLIAVVGCLLAARPLLPAAGLDPAHGYAVVSIGQARTVRAAAGSVLYLALIALFSLGVAAVVRDTAVSIGVVLGLLYLPPILAQALADPLRRHLLQVAPMSAGLAIQATTNLRSQPLGPWTGLGVLAVWAVVSLVVGGLRLRFNDA